VIIVRVGRGRGPARVNSRMIVLTRAASDPGAARISGEAWSTWGSDCGQREKTSNEWADYKPAGGQVNANFGGGPMQKLTALAPRLTHPEQTLSPAAPIMLCVFEVKPFTAVRLQRAP
jgi:hypothetical protein